MVTEKGRASSGSAVQNETTPSNKSIGYGRLQIDTNSSEAKPDSCDDTSSRQANEKATYLGLIRNNRPYRLYLASYLVARAGDWFNYVACITAIEDILGPNSKSMTAISVLVIIRLLPNVFLSSIGGALADARDRRIVMLFLDICGAVAVMLYCIACRLKSLTGIYLVSFLLESIAALYEPSKSAIIPLLVPEEEFLKKAMTLSVLAWSTMAAVGASLGGFTVSWLGIQACFGKWQKYKCAPVVLAYIV